MATARLSVRPAHDDVRVDLGLAAIQRHIADEREHLDLLAQRNLLVVARRPVEVAERDLAERADGGKVSATELLRLRERSEPRYRLIALVEDQRPCLGPGGFEHDGLHRSLSSSFSFVPTRAVAASQMPATARGSVG